MIGINNRNLKSLKTDINTTYDLFDILKDHGEPLISESGIKNDKDILNIKNKTNIKSFLIGESLLKSMESNPIFDCFALKHMFFVLMLLLDPFLDIFENVFPFKQYCCEKLLTIFSF